MSRTLLIALGLAILLAIGGLLYGRAKAQEARHASQELALERQAHQGALDQLAQQSAAVEALEAAGRAQEARIRAAEARAEAGRKEGAARARLVLLSDVPKESPALIRWATQEAQGLAARLEAP